MRILLPLLLLSGLVACKNPCQRICADMAKYAEDECDIPISDAEVKQCELEQSNASSDTRAVCRQGDDIETIRSLWDCGDVADYFPE